MGVHNLPRLLNLVRTLAVEMVRVCFIAVRHHRGVDRISGLSLYYSVTTLTCQLQFSPLVWILDP